ncbi:MAG: S24 family peptidase [Synergistaceae bacterium]|jgi:phage repressor protein C with HTH and peptisase S24 domain|nr:S24 family peptidase [Synergistaceae bacterium]MDD3093457.1 S24 family peptidase [Clostridia bacterium]
MSDKERLADFIKYTNLSVKAAAESCGVHRQAFYDILKKENVGISDNVAKAIVKTYPDINLLWLKYGEGEMLKNTDPNQPTTNQNGKGVKYFDVDFIAGFDIVLNNHTVTPAYYIDFKPYNKADYWVNVTGHSMDPLISHGDIIAIKKLNDWKTYYLPGEIYAIVTDEFRTIKKIRKGDNEGEVLLVPENLEDFDPKPISISLIRDVYQVLGCMKKII